MENGTTFNLAPCQELRLEAGKDMIYVTVVSGLVELFGTEAMAGMTYAFKDVKIAFFTWYGCKLEVRCPGNENGDEGSPVMYVAPNQSMTQYLNIHDNLNKLRRNAVKNNTKGPRVMIVGDNNVGKTTLSRLLVTYATRAGWQPSYLDLDPSSGGLMSMCGDFP